MNDLEIIQLIEKYLGFKLKQLSNFNKADRRLNVFPKGYQINSEQQVIHLSLEYCDIGKIIFHEKIFNCITKLTNLDSLYLSKNNIINITGINSLINLKTLDLSKNLLTDISSLEGLKQIKRLDLSQNFLKNISVLSRFKNIVDIQLSENQIEDITPISNLENIKRLSLSLNKIDDISPLRELKQIETLLLYNNRINEISPLKDMKFLKLLDLRKNNIRYLEAWIIDFNLKIESDGKVKDIDCIYLLDNPLVNPPVEIVKQGTKAIRNYFEELKKYGEEIIHEAKLIVMGDAGSGKTTLTRKIQKLDASLPIADETTRIFSYCFSKNRTV